jgi:1,4-dihydroxy-2-naphthoate octaprenyltransferase
MTIIFKSYFCVIFSSDVFLTYKKPTMNLIKKIVIATRAFSFQSSLIPPILGSLIAYLIAPESFQISLAIWATLTMILLHAGANMISDFFDSRKGLDTEPNPLSGAIAQKIMSAKKVLSIGVTLIIVGVASGLLLWLKTNIYVLIIGLGGTILGVCYPFLKYRRLGDLVVFLNFGILGALGAYVVQTDALAWEPVLWSIPTSLLVVSVLHANNWRDILPDKALNVSTVANTFGDNFSKRYLDFLLFGAYISLILLTFLPHLLGVPQFAINPYVLLCLLSIPQVFKIRNIAKTNDKKSLEFAALDGQCAMLNMMFGVLLLASFVIAILV